jgi:photosystem II stability/assembly factor-like uncharacterized protein
MMGSMPSDISFLAVGAEDPDVVFAASGQQFYGSSDGGNNWQEYELEIRSPVRGLVTDPIETDTVYLITGSDGFWCSENRGQTWERRGDGLFEDAELSAITALPRESGHLIVSGSNGSVWTTVNGGKSWQSIREDLAVGNITSIAVSEGLEGGILIGSSADGMGLYRPGHLLGNTP